MVHGARLRQCGAGRGGTLAARPPRIISEAEIDAMFACFERGLNKAEAMVAQEGLRDAASP